jgi:hypothetical protein
LHAELQQKPSTQDPLVHISSRVQAVPCALVPVHTRGFWVVSQKPEVQSASSVHELEHAVPDTLHVNGVQFCVGGFDTGQVPPVHALGG